ncbi:SRPBCC domain-containing protein [Acinetobacter guillouiae]|uniref:SRPBCC domain-containing protein n=1 Tax=Acinetobacter guillouiae TaxID=106649 RepID=UPI001CD4D7F6|nr:SRPBCC domain-containing protein [Acinetobacter guillouiae]
MKFEITTEILINAPIDIVWKTLTNFEDYKNWNPFIIDVSGEIHKGGKINVTIQNDATSKMSFKAVVLENQKNKQFSWRGKLLVKGVFDGEHKFRLEQITPVQTRLIHSEAFSGILVKLFLKNLQTKTKPGFQRMNNALKVRLENQ